MGFKKRLIVAFLILLIVPVFLIGMIIAATFGLQERRIHMTNETQTQNVGAVREEFSIITEEGYKEPRIMMPVIRTGLFLVFIILITAIILVIWLYKSVIHPLNVLRMATSNLKEGNLDFSISGDPNDELGQLCEDFEDMRIRLKDQIDARMKYEQDTIELISNISHDLKTPLTAIKGYSEGILDGVADTEEKRNKYVRTIYTKASDMTVLVDELSLFSKIESNILPYNYEVINVDDYFMDCTEEQSLDMEVKNVELKYTSDLGDLKVISADPEQLRRVINNILNNAVKYMDKEEGRIEIRSFSEDDMIRIEIEDNGAGIAQEDIGHIFERFYRADASRGTSKKGSGLGLAIARKIIEDHGGSIDVRSKLKEGSVFILRLPKYTKYEDYDEVEDAEYERVHTRKNAEKRNREERRRRFQYRKEEDRK